MGRRTRGHVRSIVQEVQIVGDLPYPGRTLLRAAMKERGYLILYGRFMKQLRTKECIPWDDGIRIPSSIVAI